MTHAASYNPPDRPVFRLENVGKTYNDRKVLDGLDLDIRPGEVVAIVGPNGAGKSTLLRILNLLEAPSEGNVEYGGGAVEYPPPLAMRRDRGCAASGHQTPARPCWSGLS